MAAPSASLEVELKLLPPAGFDLTALGDGTVRERRFTSAYWDTPRRTLGEAGLTLRRRTEGRTSLWQLKLPAAGGRTELELRGGTTPPAELVAALRAHTELAGELAEVARLRTLRRSLEIDTKHGRVEVSLDAVGVFDGRKKTGGFAELELELLDGDRRALAPLAKRIGGAPAPATTKLERALGAPAGEERSRLETLFRTRLRALLAYDPGARVASNPEDVHQLRVALRRTLSLLRGAADSLDPEWAEQVRVEAQWLVRALSPARDADVFHLWLQAQAGRLGVDGRALARLDARLAAARADGHAAAQAALDDPRLLALLRLLDAPHLLDGDPAFLPLARSETARLRRLARKAGKHPDDELLHRLRLRGKRARYALELAAPELGKRSKEALDAARELQDVLGEHQDAVEAEQRLRTLAASTRGGTALALGRLVELQNVRRQQAVRAFPAAWRRFDAAASKI